MSISHTVGVYHSTGNNPISTRNAVTGNTEINLVFTLAGSTTDQEQQVGFDAADVNAVTITVEDNNGAVTLQTNDATTSAHNGAVGNGFAFPADGGEMHWSTRSPLSSPFGSTDVTTTYWSNPGADDATVTVKILLDT